MNDLRDMFNDLEATHASEGPAGLDPTSRGVVTGRIRRSRRTRAVVLSGAGALIVAVVATTAWGLARLGEPEPVLAPSPTASPSQASATPSVPSPSVTPSPEIVLTMPAFAGTVTVDEHLPSALPITPEAWNEAGPGWVLATYREWVVTGHEGDDPVNSVGPQVAYLISPTGDRYELTQIPGDEGIEIYAWDPQASTALAFALPSGSDGWWVVLDLVTGTTRPLEETDVAASGWTLADVTRPWVSSRLGGWPFRDLPPEPPAQLTPSEVGSALAAAQATISSTETCQLVMPLASGGMAVGCGQRLIVEHDPEAEAFAYHFIVFLDERGGVIGAPVGAALPGTSAVATAIEGVGDGVRLSLTEDTECPGCTSNIVFATPDGVVTLAGIEGLRAADPSNRVFISVGHAGGALYTAMSSRSAAIVTTLVRDDPSTGTSTVLIPPSEWCEGNGRTPPDYPWCSDTILRVYVVPDSKPGVSS